MIAIITNEAATPVTNTPIEVKNVSIKMKQDIFVKGNLILTADVYLATINKEGKPTKMPEKLKEQLTK